MVTDVKTVIVYRFISATVYVLSDDDDDDDNDDAYDKYDDDDDSVTLPSVSCWHPVSMGAAMVNNDGATIVMVVGTPAMKAFPVMMVMMVIII